MKFLVEGEKRIVITFSLTRFSNVRGSTAHIEKTASPQGGCNWHVKSRLTTMLNSADLLHRENEILINCKKVKNLQLLYSLKGQRPLLVLKSLNQPFSCVVVFNKSSIKVAGDKDIIFNYILMERNCCFNACDDIFF